MKLKEGDLTPNFSYVDRSGKSMKFHDLKGKKVIFFFPKAFTAGCTRQSISMQENYQELKDMGVTEIFGISVDTEEILEKFCNKYNFEYIFVSDQSKEISKSFGVYKNLLVTSYANRDTFIVDDQNKIEQILHNGLSGKSSEMGLSKHGIEIKQYIKI
ncbi:MAG: redoxin domain-containing protein [Candidatus Heimdallarchaeota archaeon]|nr:redoxin domain-containing protein [Candidatus Heimdallarchaeota archaeon]